MFSSSSTRVIFAICGRGLLNRNGSVLVLHRGLNGASGKRNKVNAALNLFGEHDSPWGIVCMDGHPIHFEVYIRKVPGGPWVLDLATENRANAIRHAEDLMKEGRCAAARVSKETFDDETREFQTI